LTFVRLRCWSWDQFTSRTAGESRSERRAEAPLAAAGCEWFHGRVIICVCKAVRAQVLLERIAAGERSLEDLARSTGVTTDCGTCAAMILGMIEDANARAARGASPGGTA
jgi:bacterioferritin-associated ferredoxin